jgi:hypothetical protein
MTNSTGAGIATIVTSQIATIRKKFLQGLLEIHYLEEKMKKKTITFF